MIPVYVNNFNLLTWPKAMCEWLENTGDAKVVIVDNNSTYQPLIDWYDNGCPYEVVRLEKNLGKYAPWKSGTINKINNRIGVANYAVTDPDLCFDECPKDVLRFLLSGLNKHRANKAGVSLDISSVHEGQIGYPDAVRFERKYWKKKKCEDFYQARTDTTLAVYGEHSSFAPSDKDIRSRVPYSAKHLPWHLKKGSIENEYRNYLITARNGYWNDSLCRKLSVPIPNAKPPIPKEIAGRFNLSIRMSDDSLFAISEILHAFAPKSIIENGSGASTLVFLQYKKENPNVSFISHTEIGSFNNTLYDCISEMSLDKSCVIESKVCRRRRFYPVTGRCPDRSCDLIICDGPYGKNRITRHSESYVFKKTHEKSIIIVDDCQRQKEFLFIMKILEKRRRCDYQKIYVRDSAIPDRVTAILIPAAAIETDDQKNTIKRISGR